MSQEVKEVKEVVKKDDTITKRPTTLDQLTETPEFKSFYSEVLRLHRGPDPPGADADEDPTRVLVHEIKKQWVYLIAIIPQLFDRNGNHNGGGHRHVRMRIDVAGNVFHPSGKVSQGNIFQAPHYGFDILASGGNLTTKNMRSPAWVQRELQRWKPYLKGRAAPLNPLHLEEGEGDRLIRCFKVNFPFYDLTFVKKRSTHQAQWRHERVNRNDSVPLHWCLQRCHWHLA